MSVLISSAHRFAAFFSPLGVKHLSIICLARLVPYIGLVLLQDHMTWELWFRDG